jgi:hypothetical protein
VGRSQRLKKSAFRLDSVKGQLYLLNSSYFLIHQFRKAKVRQIKLRYKRRLDYEKEEKTNRKGKPKEWSGI